MKSPILVSAALLALSVLPAAAADVGVSVSISQPGVYGRIDIGKFPQPQVIITQPVLIRQPPPQVVVQPEPVYMWVPPGHQKNWRKHCWRYSACGTPVYFVQDGWYHEHVHAQSASYSGKGRGKGHGKHDD
jgi:hypothetical protein